MELDWKRLSQRIREILEELVAMKSTTCSRAEQEPARYFADFFAALPYFQEHPEDMGCLAIPDDPYGRSVPYALLRGKTKDTVVLSGHFDVVSSEEYGAAEEFAYTLESPELEERLRA